MVIVPWGRFTMGSPVTEPGRSVGEDQVSIVLPRYFSISQSAVTIAEWEACVTAGGCKPHDRIVGSPEPPDKARAEATFSGAQSYVWWLSAKTGGRYRLPSEAEWEYTIRAGTSTRSHNSLIRRPLTRRWWTWDLVQANGSAPSL